MSESSKPSGQTPSNADPQGPKARRKAPPSPHQVAALKRLAFVLMIFSLFGITALFMVSFCAMEDCCGRRTEPCKPDLASCPETGCADAETPEAVLNRLRHQRPASTAQVLLTFDDLDDLQNAAEVVACQRCPLSKEKRGGLHSLKTRAARVGEGDFVVLTGYIVSNPHDDRSGASANCRLRGRANNDFHIALARASTETEHDSILTAMIPQQRPPP